MAAASSAASTGIEPGERDGHGERAPTEIIESKETYRGFIALRLATLRLADGARVSREIEHGKAAVALSQRRPARHRHASACPCQPFNA
jgi:hypothetical protein